MEPAEICPASLSLPPLFKRVVHWVEHVLGKPTFHGWYQPLQLQQLSDAQIHRCLLYSILSVFCFSLRIVAAISRATSMTFGELRSNNHPHNIKENFQHVKLTNTMWETWQHMWQTVNSSSGIRLPHQRDYHVSLAGLGIVNCPTETIIKCYSAVWFWLPLCILLTIS